jgi:hypothetical protein
LIATTNAQKLRDTRIVVKLNDAIDLVEEGDVAEPVRLTRKELYEKVWSQPVRTVAKEFGISDVGLTKTCRRHNIPTPGLGYWAKVEHGKTVRRAELPPGKRGESDIIVIKAEATYHPWQVSAEAAPDWVERESLPDYCVSVSTDGPRHPLVQQTAARLKKEKGDGWLVLPHGYLNVRVSREQVSRAVGIVDALFAAFEKRGWAVATEAPMPRRRNSSGNFWHPSNGWTRELPKERAPEMGVVIRGQFVAFSVIETSRQEPPSEADIRAWRRQYPYGVGGPPPRPVPDGQLVLEIASHPWVSTRRRFRDSEKKPLEDQLNAVIVACVRMAAGLRSFALKMAIERREKLLDERRRRDEERRRKALEQNIAHLERGIERWRWRAIAEEFLAFARSEGAQRSIDQEQFSEWLRWAEHYVRARGHDAFFKRWMSSDRSGVELPD